MAFQHLGYNHSSPYGNQLSYLLVNFEASFNGLTNSNGLIGTMALMIDGDGSQDAHYAEIKTQFGFATDAAARAAFNELLSVQGKLNTDASVSSVHAAITQALNKFR